MLELVISGGQTGADQAGWHAAEACGLKTGGWMPRGFRDETGYHPEFATQFNAREWPNDSYPPRTRENVKWGNGTIRFATKWHSPGEICTLRYINALDRPSFDINPFRDDVNKKIEDAVWWFKEYKIKVLNVAGNSASTSPKIGEATKLILVQIFFLLTSEPYDVEVQP